MVRNKIKIIIVLLIISYFIIPNSQAGLYAKETLRLLAVYFLFIYIIYAITILNLLKRSVRKMLDNICDETVEPVVKKMKWAVELKRFFGYSGLQNIFNEVNESKKVKQSLKRDLYRIISKTGVEISPP